MLMAGGDGTGRLLTRLLIGNRSLYTRFLYGRIGSDADHQITVWGSRYRSCGAVKGV